jgi:hypothetical protein
MSNPIRAEACVKAARAARADTLVNVKVIVGKKASETIHCGHMDMGNKLATCMPLNATAIGYRCNQKALLDFFVANPTTNFASFTMVKAKVTLKADANIDAAAKVADYTAADDMVFACCDALTGATCSDCPHYALELLAACKMALAEGRVQFKK